MKISENLANIREKIAYYTDPKKIRIVAASKFQSVETIREASACGITDFGVNYAQEGKEIKEALKGISICWHFIGHIQSRKVKDLLSYDCVQSFDRKELIQEFQKRALQENLKKEILIQVNIGEEPQKSGVKPAELSSLLVDVRNMPGVIVKGLMTMPPALEPIEKRLPYFEKMRELFEASGFDSENHKLSMGTSEDYALAVKAGANMIRLGTCLLGKRSTS